MLKNYFKTAWRSLVKSRAYSTINIVGLAAGMAVAMIIGLWIFDEVSANSHFENPKNLYRVMMYQTFEGRRNAQRALPFPLAQELKEQYPDFKAVTLCDWGNQYSLMYGDKKVARIGHAVGEEAIEIFSLKILAGSANPLQDPYVIVLTDKTAKALFGNEDPIGKTVKLDNSTALKVTAIVTEQPQNSSLNFDFLLPIKLVETYDYIKNYHKENWINNSWQIFVRTNDQSSEQVVNDKIKGIVLSHLQDENTQTSIKPELFIHPASKWRLYNQFEDGKNIGGYIKYVRLFGILGMVVLLIACINFMNLSTARSEKRAREVGVRKAIGAGRGNLIKQFLSESMLVAFIAFLIALLLVALSLPYFNTLTGKEMTLQVNNITFWGVMCVFTAITGLLAGSYPALYLSAFNPVRVLKGMLRTGRSSVLPRKILVVTQFVCTVVLMIATIVIYQQIQFGKDQPIGYDTSGLISVRWSTDIKKNLESLKHELVATGAVLSISQSNSLPTEVFSRNHGWEWKNSQPLDKATMFTTIVTTYDYTKTMGIKMLEGRDFSRNFSDSNSVMLNEAAVKRMGLEHPVGETLKWNGRTMTVVGIVPDIQMETPFSPISPATILFDKDWVSHLLVRLNPVMPASKAINLMQPVFDKFNPSSPFEYKFADEEYAKKFNYEELVGNLAAVIAALAIFISCLGLFGLASFTAEQRIKEIGVRKILGASVINLWKLLSKDFVLLVAIACVIAVPLAYYAVNEWLKNYDYKTDISVVVFIAVILVSLLITLATISFQAIRAAMANPVKALRSE